MLLAERFMKRLAGLDRAYGTFTISPNAKPDGNGKIKGKARTVTGKVTVEHWENHLAGKIGLGIIPIQADNSCVWGCIDNDEIPLDHEQIEREIVAKELPLIVCKSKSGGAHLLMFTSEPVPAELMRTKLDMCRAALGYDDKIEIFPKQIELENKSIGNWLNMPYYDSDSEKTARYAIRDSVPLSALEFLDYADARQISKAQLEALNVRGTAKPAQAVKGNKTDTASKRIVEGTSVQGQLHNDLKSYIVSLRKSGSVSIPDMWVLYKDKLEKNHVKDHDGLIKWAEKYIEPEKQDGGVFSNLVRIMCDPPAYRLDYNGEKIDISTTAILDSYPAVRRRIMESVGVVPPLMSAKKWNEILEELFVNRTDEEFSDDLSPKGVAWQHIMNYCTSKAQAKDKQEITMGKPWHDEESGRCYIKTESLTGYLKQQRVFMEPRDIGFILRDHGGAPTTLYIKGRQVRVWHLPSDVIQEQVQKESFDVPPVPLDEEVVY
jgi:hypothetical protein